MYLRWCEIWKIGHMTSWCFLPSWLAFSASFILLLNSRSVSSMSSNPAGGGLRMRDVRTGGMIGRSKDVVGIGEKGDDTKSEGLIGFV